MVLPEMGIRKAVARCDACFRRHDGMGGLMQVRYNNSPCAAA
jgi:hypothetical protein